MPVSPAAVAFASQATVPPASAASIPSAPCPFFPSAAQVADTTVQPSPSCRPPAGLRITASTATTVSYRYHSVLGVAVFLPWGSTGSQFSATWPCAAPGDAASLCATALADAVVRYGSGVRPAAARP